MNSPSSEVYLKIGDVARRVGVSPSVIRSWESLGLTRPRRSESKYRLYTPDDVKLLKRARFLRKVRGLNAAAIVELLRREGRVRPAAPGGAGAIGSHLRKLRAKRRLSLAQVARAVGVSVGFLSALERSQMSGSVGTLRKLARFYKTNILDFFDATGASSRQVQPEQRKVLKPGPACVWSCWLGETPPSWSPTCFAWRRKPAAETPTCTRAKSSSTCCVENSRSLWKKKNTGSRMATAFILRVQLLTIGKIQGGRKPGCCG